MKKLLAIIVILSAFNAYSQNTTTLPSPTTQFNPSFRYYGTLLDTLRQTWMQTPGGGWNRIFTATDINARKGAVNGFATLDGSGKIPLAQLPANILVYKGQWNPSTNTPTLVNGTGTTGDVWEASADGNHDFGAGTLHFLQGDFVIYNGSQWQLSAGTDRVTSVNGYQGIVVLNTDDIPEGTINKYYTDARVQAFSDVRYVPYTGATQRIVTNYGLSTQETLVFTLGGGDGSQSIRFNNNDGTQDVFYHNANGGLAYQSANGNDFHVVGNFVADAAQVYATPSTSYDVVNLSYLSNYGKLSATNSWSGAVNVFSNEIRANGGVNMQYTTGNEPAISWQNLTTGFPISIKPAPPTASRVLTLPDATGTVALLSDITSSISGTTNYIPKFTGANAIGNSLIYDNGTNIGIGIASPIAKIDIRTGATGGILINSTTTSTLPTNYASLNVIANSATALIYAVRDATVTAYTDFVSFSGSGATRMGVFRFFPQNGNSTTQEMSIASTGVTVAHSLTVAGNITFSGLSTAGIVHNSAAGLLSTSLIATGDITNNAVTLAKIQNLSAAGRLMGTGSSGFGVSELTIGTGLSMSGTTLSGAPLGTTLAAYTISDAYTKTASDAKYGKLTTTNNWTGINEFSVNVGAGGIDLSNYPSGSGALVIGQNYTSGGGETDLFVGIGSSGTVGGLNVYGFTNSGTVTQLLYLNGTSKNLQTFGSITPGVVNHSSATTNNFAQFNQTTGEIEYRSKADVISDLGLSGATGANPTSSIGLTAINGSATTFMRSDAAQPLDLTISPTWSGNHDFSESLSVNVLNVYGGGTALGSGIYMYSPDGSRWVVSVSNVGIVSATAAP